MEPKVLSMDLPFSVQGLSNSECQIEPTIGQVGAILGFLEVIASAPSFGVPDRVPLLHASNTRALSFLA